MMTLSVTFLTDLTRIQDEFARAFYGESLEHNLLTGEWDIAEFIHVDALRIVLQHIAVVVKK